MSDIPDIEYLVRLWAQILYYDHETDEWIALADNKISHIVVMKRRISPLYHTGERSDVNDGLLPHASPSALAFKYYIQGRRINDGKIFFEYIIEQDLIYVEAESCFHYWYNTGKNRFGIQFERAAHSNAFAHIVRDAIEIVTDEYLQEKEARCVVEFHRNERKPRHVHFSNRDDLYLYSQKDEEQRQEAMASAKVSFILKKDSGFRQNLIREKLLEDDIVQLEPIQVDPILEKLTQREAAKKELAPVESIQEEFVQMVQDKIEKGQTEPSQEKLKTVQQTIVWIFLCAALLILFVLCLKLFLR